MLECQHCFWKLLASHCILCFDLITWLLNKISSTCGDLHTLVVVIPIYTTPEHVVVSLQIDRLLSKIWRNPSMLSSVWWCWRWCLLDLPPLKRQNESSLDWTGFNDDPLDCLIWAFNAFWCCGLMIRSCLFCSSLCVLLMIVLLDFLTLFVFVSGGMHPGKLKLFRDAPIWGDGSGSFGTGTLSCPVKRGLPCHRVSTSVKSTSKLSRLESNESENRQRKESERSVYSVSCVDEDDADNVVATDIWSWSSWKDSLFAFLLCLLRLLRCDDTESSNDLVGRLALSATSRTSLSLDEDEVDLLLSKAARKQLPSTTESDAVSIIFFFFVSMGVLANQNYKSFDFVSPRIKLCFSTREIHNGCRYRTFLLSGREAR